MITKDQVEAGDVTGTLALSIDALIACWFLFVALTESVNEVCVGNRMIPYLDFPLPTILTASTWLALIDHVAQLQQGEGEMG